MEMDLTLWGGFKPLLRRTDDSELNILGEMEHYFEDNFVFTSANIKDLW